MKTYLKEYLEAAEYGKPEKTISDPKGIPDIPWPSITSDPKLRALWGLYAGADGIAEWRMIASRPTESPVWKIENRY